MPIFSHFTQFSQGISNLFKGVSQEWITEILIHGKKYRIIHVPLLEGFTHWRALKAAGGSEEDLKKYIQASREKKLKELFIAVQQEYRINPSKADQPKLHKLRLSFEKTRNREAVHSKIQKALETVQFIDNSAPTVKQVREWLYYNEMLTADEHEITADIMEEVRGIYSFLKQSSKRLNLGLAKYLLSIQEKKFNDFKKFLDQENSHPEISRNLKKTRVLIEELEKSEPQKHKQHKEK